MAFNNEEDVAREVKKLMNKNSLTFADDTYLAHFLARNSILSSGADARRDERRNFKKLAAGFPHEQKQARIQGNPIAGTKAASTKRIKSELMGKALKNLEKKYSVDEIADMLKYTSNKVYSNNMNDTYNTNPQIQDYQQLIYAMKSEDNPGNFELVRNSDTSPVVNNIATTQSLLSLGIDKSEFFTTLFKYGMDDHSATAPTTRAQFKSQMGSLLHLTNKYGNGAGVGSKLLSENSNYLERAATMLC